MSFLDDLEESFISSDLSTKFENLNSFQIQEENVESLDDDESLDDSQYFDSLSSPLISSDLKSPEKEKDQKQTTASEVRSDYMLAATSPYKAAAEEQVRNLNSCVKLLKFKYNL
jgi:hypothetical protein